MFLLFRAIMHDVSNDNRVLSLVAQSGIRNTLVTLLDQLQRCQKSLNEFLEVRIVFLYIFIVLLVQRNGQNRSNFIRRLYQLPIE